MAQHSPFIGAFERMLMCEMPDEMRQSIHALLARDKVSEYEYKSAYANFARRLVLAKPREQIDWNPTVNAESCIGCETCFAYCPHGVYEMKDGKAVVAHPHECVILCHNCEAMCPAAAIAFPPQKNYVELLRYE